MNDTNTIEATQQNIAQAARVTRILLGMTIGATRNVYGVVVTRWGDDSFEVGTWGKTTQDLASLVEWLI